MLSPKITAHKITFPKSKGDQPSFNWKITFGSMSIKDGRGITVEITWKLGNTEGLGLDVQWSKIMYATFTIKIPNRLNPPFIMLDSSGTDG